MSKAILSLFCVAALYSSGLVLAKPQSGNAVKNVADKGGDLASNAIKGLAAGYANDSIEAQAINLGGEAVNAIVDTLGGLAGGAINGAESTAKKTKELAGAGYDAAKAGINKVTDKIENSGKGGQQQQQGGQQQQQGGQHQSNGGNTIQIPTIFFLILAIFNH